MEKHTANHLAGRGSACHSIVFVDLCTALPSRYWGNWSLTGLMAGAILSGSHAGDHHASSSQSQLAAERTRCLSIGRGRCSRRNQTDQ